MGPWRFTLFLLLAAAPGCYTAGPQSERPGAAPCRCEPAPDDAGPEPATPPLPPGRDDAVNIRIAREPDTLLPLTDPDPAVRAIADHDIYESLVRASRDGRSVVPELAVSWTASEDRLSYRFALDGKARWHDGRPVTAEDVRFTFSRLIDPDSRAALQGEFAEVKKVSAADARTVDFLLDRPRPGFLFALGDVPIVPAHVFGQTPLARHPAARAPVGSGPFRFASWAPGSAIALERNPFWRGARPALARIVYRIVPDNRVALDLFRRGDLDIVPELPAGAADMPGQGRLITYRLPRFEAWVYNTARPMFAGEKARQAAGMLIDREAIRCAILRCRADLAEGPWLLPDPARTGASPLRFDPARARALLDADGWIDRDGDGVRERGGIRFAFDVMLADEDPDLKRAAAVVQDDMARAGIAMRVVLVGRATYVERLANRRFDAAIVTVQTRPFFDPSPLFHSRYASLGENLSGLADPELDRLLDQLAAEGDLEARAGFERRIDQRLRAASPVTFTLRPHGAALISPRVAGVRIRDGWIEERLLFAAAGPGRTGGAP